MALSESAQISSPQVQVHNQEEFHLLATLGEYSVYPLQYCSEDQIAKLFSKICQRGNPVLQGKPTADLILLGRAMYRKANLLNLGQVVVHQGEPVAMGASWDVAAGGVWKDSGLERPASMTLHAACGGAAFDSAVARMPPAARKRGVTMFSGFFGVLPPHDGYMFGILAVSSFIMGHLSGFQSGLQFTLLPTLNKRGGVFGKFGSEEDNAQWDIPFSAVADSLEGPAADDLREMGGNINISLTTMDFALNLTGKGEEWFARAAASCRLDGAEAIRRPAEEMAVNQMNWARQKQSSNVIASRL